MPECIACDTLRIANIAILRLIQSESHFGIAEEKNENKRRKYKITQIVGRHFVCCEVK
jgi:hypothetical protein